MFDKWQFLFEILYRINSLITPLPFSYIWEDYLYIEIVLNKLIYYIANLLCLMYNSDILNGLHSIVGIKSSLVEVYVDGLKI
jgi:hypothetical protein